MVGADPANLVNEAAIIAARHNHDRVQQHDFTEALEKMVLGTERRIMLAGGAGAHRAVPRERSRVARNAVAGRRPGAQDLDRPARARSG